MSSENIFRRMHCLRAAARLVVLGMLAVTLLATPTQAQTLNRDTHIIKRAYFAMFRFLYEGDYENAMEGFRDVWRGGIQTVDARWIDSICYHTMIGEIHYRLGQNRLALENYDAALRLYIQYPDWMLRVQFPDAIEPNQNIFRPPPWGQSKRRFVLGRFPDNYSIARGGTRVVTLNGRQGVANRHQLHPIDVDEMIRCTALSIRRRKELLGPVARHDRLTQEILNTLSLRQGPPNHWSQAWIDLALGAAFASNDKTEQAVKSLQAALLVGGELDHPLTCVAMLELGRIALEAGDYKSAAVWLDEAAASAYYFDRPETIEEAFRLRQQVHLLTGGKEIYPPLVAAANWANLKNLEEVYASLLIQIAEHYAILGDGKNARSVLGQATRAMTHEDLDKGWLMPRLNYVTAVVHYFSDNSKSGDLALAAAMQYQKEGSIRLFQITAADAAYVNGHVRERSALELYEQVLSDPSPDEWRRDPLEALTLLLFPQETAMEHWFDAAMQRGDGPKALKVLDRVRRSRFYAALPMGGRLLALRWILFGPPEVLSDKAELQRADIMARYPEFVKLDDAGTELKKQIAELPVIPRQSKEALELGKLLKQLATVGDEQEKLLRKIAVSREPSELVFPFMQATADIQKQLKPTEAIMLFHVGKRSDHAFFITDKNHVYRKIDAPEKVRDALSELLRLMGHFDQGRELDGRILSDTSWRRASYELAKLVFGEDTNLDGIEELVIVPDGTYWYIPFEALYLNGGPRSMPLLYRTRIRYAPTLGLAVGDLRPRRKNGEYLVVQGRLFPREDPAIAADAFLQIKQTVPSAHALTQQVFGPANALVPMLEGIVVLDDIEPVDRSPLDMAPLQVNRGKPGASIGEWMGLPWGNPDIVLLPGFHTPAESSVKRLDTRLRPGDELFMSTMALLAGGSRTVLISRWRTAGQTGNTLLREFLQELPNMSAPDAWQRSVQLAYETPIDPNFEPRVKSNDEVGNLTGAHPFFWSGYLLVDSGDDPKAAAVVPAVKQPAAGG